MKVRYLFVLLFLCMGCRTTCHDGFVYGNYRSCTTSLFNHDMPCLEERPCRCSQNCPCWREHEDPGTPTSG